MIQSPLSDLTRRGVLQTLCGGALTGVVAPWALNLSALATATAADVDDYKALVCLFQLGGNDQDNTVVPYDAVSYGRYAAIRGRGASTIAIARSQLDDTVLRPATALPGERVYALHPSLRGLAELFNKGRAAIQLNVGPLIAPLTRAQYEAGDRRVAVPPKLFSHNDQQSTTQAAAPEGLSLGYGGRMGDALVARNRYNLLTAISVDSGNPVFLAGMGVAAYQMTVQGTLPIHPVVSESGPLSTALAALLQAPRRHVLEEAYSQVLRQSLAANSIVSAALGGYKPPDEVPFLSKQLRLVVRMAAANAALGLKRQVFFIQQTSYDTHGSQTALHSRLMAELSVAVVDFQNEASAAGLTDKLTLFTASDFGRTLTSNGDGTDHGWGGHHFMVGGAVKGQAFYGTPPPISIGNSSSPEDQWHVGQGRLLPSTSVAQFMATFARWMDVPADKLAAVIPDLSNFGAAVGRPDYPIDMGFMR